MEIGVTIFATDLTMRVDDVAVEAEARGFYSLYVPEHTHIPASRATPAPTGTDELDEGYKRTLDPLIALAAAAGRTRSIRLGTAVALPAEHDPIAWAKAVATLDHISDGRVTVGVGYGWNREELLDHGVAFSDRRAVVRESMLLARSLWSSTVGAFEGSHVSVSPSWAWPKPVQARVPVLVGGGAGPKLFADIAEWGDGWIPFGGSGLATALPQLRAAAEEAGRHPDSLVAVPMGVLPTPAKLDYFRQLGVTECVLRLPAGDRESVLPALDELAGYVAGG